MKKLVTLFVSLCLAASVWARSSTFVDISHQELKTVVAQKKAVIFDVNGTESYKEGHIPGAIDFVANQDKIASLLPADKNALIVAYCGNEQCPAYQQAANAAAKLGYTNIKHYAPGIDGWKKSGAPLEKEKS
jgi:rhodanese-related sulfurtransferase